MTINSIRTIKSEDDLFESLVGFVTQVIIINDERNLI